MTPPFADALTWVPKSRALGGTLTRAHDLARARSHANVTLEHVLQALIEDPDASAVLLACHVDLLSLNAAVASFIQGQPAGSAEMPAADPSLLNILEYAVAAARQSRRNEINGAIVLAAIVGEGKSEAAGLLQTAGLKFQDAVAALKKANAAQRPAMHEEASQPQSGQPQSGGAVPRPIAEAPAAVAPASDPDPTPLPRVAATNEVLPTAPASTGAAQGRPQPNEDPVTTARRRIEAIRSGQPLASLDGQGNTTPTPAHNAAPVGPDWAPPPLPQNSASQGARPARMPPPVPPIEEPPQKRNGSARGHASATGVPWADGSDDVPAPVRHGVPIEPERLIERIPERMLAKATITIEIRIPRAQVLVTAATANSHLTDARDIVLTRALTVKLRAPSGGFHIENAAPETQWFDARSTQRDEDEVRWRWQVTPHAPGFLPLGLALSMRTVASDGMIVETMLPEYQATVRIVRNHAADMRIWFGWVAAGAVGALLAFGLSGGFAAALGWLFR